MNAKKWIVGALIVLLAGCGVSVFIWTTNIETEQLSAVLPDGRVLAMVKTPTGGNEVRLIGTDGTLVGSAPTDVTLAYANTALLLQSSDDQAMWFDEINHTIIRVNVTDLTAAVTDTVPTPTGTNISTFAPMAKPLPDGGAILLRNLYYADYTVFPNQMTNYQVQLVHVGPDGVIVQTQSLTDPAQAGLLRVTQDQVDISAGSPQVSGIAAVVHLDGAFNEISRLALPAGSTSVLEDNSGHLWVASRQTDGSESWQILDSDGNVLATPAITCGGGRSVFTRDNHLVVASSSYVTNNKTSVCVGQYDADGQPVFEKTFTFTGQDVTVGSIPYVDDQDNVALVTRWTRGPVTVGVINTCVLYESDVSMQVRFFNAGGAAQSQANFATDRSRFGWDPNSQSTCGTADHPVGVYDLITARLLGPGHMVAVAYQTGGTDPQDFATLIQTVKP